MKLSDTRYKEDRDKVLRNEETKYYPLKNKELNANKLSDDDMVLLEHYTALVFKNRKSLPTIILAKVALGLPSIIEFRELMREKTAHDGDLFAKELNNINTSVLLNAWKNTAMDLQSDASAAKRAIDVINILQKEAKDGYNSDTYDANESYKVTLDNNLLADTYNEFKKFNNIE